MDLFNNYDLYNRHIKAINPILLIDMCTSLLSYNHTFNYLPLHCKSSYDIRTF